jgi:aromatic ring-cleaving dioxygenase
MRQNRALPTVAPPADPQIIRHYHAHVYYDPVSSRDRAARLRERVAATFPDATLGRWHDALVGPHPQSMYQIAFPSALLASFLPWLMLNRRFRSRTTFRLIGGLSGRPSELRSWPRRRLVRKNSMAWHVV